MQFREGFASMRVRKVIAPMAQDDMPMTDGLDRFAFARIRCFCGGDGSRDKMTRESVATSVAPTTPASDMSAGHKIGASPAPNAVKIRVSMLFSPTFTSGKSPTAR